VVGERVRRSFREGGGGNCRFGGFPRKKRKRKRKKEKEKEKEKRKKEIKD